MQLVSSGEFAGAKHRAVPPTTAISSATGESEIASTDASQPQLKFVVEYREAAKRKQKVFQTEEEAIEFARSKNPKFRCDAIQETESEASAHVSLECTNRLNAYGKTIKDATDLFVQHLTATEKSCTVAKLVDEFVAAKQKQAASQFDLDDLRSRLTTFGKRFNGCLVETITSAQIDEWLRSLNISIVTRNHYRRLIMLTFTFAVQRGYTNSNPVFARFVVSRDFSFAANPQNDRARSFLNSRPARTVRFLWQLDRKTESQPHVIGRNTLPSRLRS